jgi:large subunit ribosomal protein L10
MLDQAGVIDLAETPSKEVLIGRMMGSLQSSLYSFAYVLQAIIDKDGEAAPAEDAAPAEEAPAEA